MRRYNHPIYYDSNYDALYINPEIMNKVDENIIKKFLWKIRMLNKTKTTKGVQMYIEDNNVVLQHFNWKIKINSSTQNIESFIMVKYLYRDNSRISNYDSFILKVSKILNDVSEVFWINDASYLRLLVEYEELFEKMEIIEWLRRFFAKFSDHYLYTDDLKEIVEHDKIINEKSIKYYTQPNRYPITNINGETIGYYEYGPLLFEELTEPYINVNSPNVNDYKKLLEFFERNYETVSPEHKEIVDKIIENLKKDIKTYEEFSTKYKEII